MGPAVKPTMATPGVLVVFRLTVASVGAPLPSTMPVMVSRLVLYGIWKVSVLTGWAVPLLL